MQEDARSTSTQELAQTMPWIEIHLRRL